MLLLRAPRAADGGPMTARELAALAYRRLDTHANEGGPVGSPGVIDCQASTARLAEFESGLGERCVDAVVWRSRPSWRTRRHRTGSAKAPITAHTTPLRCSPVGA